MLKPPLPQPMPHPSRHNKMFALRAGGALALLAAMVSGCQQDTDPGPGGVTVGEARALDQAAEMLDAQVPPATPVPTSPAPVTPAN